jgi:hypothetical protein
LKLRRRRMIRQEPLHGQPDKDAPHCTCPDHETRGVKCKHIFAVEYAISCERNQDGSTTVTETVTVQRTVKRTYPQNWPAYNARPDAREGSLPRPEDFTFRSSRSFPAERLLDGAPLQQTELRPKAGAARRIVLGRFQGRLRLDAHEKGLIFPDGCDFIADYELRPPIEEPAARRAPNKRHLPFERPGSRRSARAGARRRA